MPLRYAGSGAARASRLARLRRRTAAHAAFDEAEKRQLAAGMLAHLVRIDNDLRTIAAADIRARACRTHNRGHTVFPR